MDLPSVSLGVIPSSAPERPLWPLEAFTVFDDERVHVELLSAQVTVTAPSEIILYVRAFEKLAALAVHGPAAAELDHGCDQCARLIASQLPATLFTCPASPRVG